MQPSPLSMSKVKTMSLILIGCSVGQLAISLSLLIIGLNTDAEIFLLSCFVLPQIIGSVAVLSYAQKPTSKKFTPQYFAILGSIIVTLVFLVFVVFFIPTALSSSEFILVRVTLFLSGLLPCVWLVTAIVYTMNVLRQA